MSERSPLLKRKPPATGKLDTFEGVFLPTTLNVLSILMFLRFGFIIGQMGICGTFLLLFMSYFINILTTMSISAISTNGTVKGGGAYYMISRSLGPEFGGAIGIIFFIGQILNSSLNVVGFIEPLLLNFNTKDGDIARILPIDYWWQLLYSTILLAACTGIALVGSSLVSKTAFLLFIILTFSTLSIPVSTLFVKPFYPLENVWYSGLSWSTFIENLWPHFTSGAAGSVLPPGESETFKNLFGIFFPATAGIFAGASMSGDLINPSKSIPEGTIKGLGVSFILYSLVIISVGCAMPRELLHADIEVLQSVNVSGFIILLGEFSTSLFSVIMGIVGSATLLSAIADDRIIPGLSAFTTRKKSIMEKRKGEMLAIFATWFMAQIFLFADINQIATFITMAFLMTFIVTNLACFLLRVGSAPNFRPSFKYFSSRTAFTGGLSSIVAMYIVDGVSATTVIVCLVILIMMIHYVTPPLRFGDISQLLIYHQVRKYLLRLKLQMSVKYWRPQILLLCDDPRSSWNLIGFCNHLKKGGLYILGHVVLMDKDNQDFSLEGYKEIQKQRQAWTKLRALSKIKAFVQIALGPTLPWGVRNVYLGSGLGGMRPNITVLGFYDSVKHGTKFPLMTSKPKKVLLLPTDDCRKEKKVSINQWVQIVEELIIMQATVAVAANFTSLNLPSSSEEETTLDFHPHTHSRIHFWSKPKMAPGKVKYIDLYPIQMSSISYLENGKSVLSTNFDTYTLILQLGAILSTVPEWKFTSHVLRVVVFVESEEEVNDEHSRLQDLLSSLRIDAEIKVVRLNDGSLSSYNFLVSGYNVTPSNKHEYERLDTALKGDQWWKNLCNARTTLKDLDKQRAVRTKSLSRLKVPFDFGLSKSHNSSGILKPNKKNRRYTISNLHGQGLSLSLNMKSQQENFFKDPNYSSESSDSESEKGEQSTYDSDLSSMSEYPTAPQAKPQKLGKQGSVYFRKNHSLFPNTKGVYKSSDQLSVRSSRSNLRPNFLAVKIPQSQINDNDEEDDGHESDGDNKPSIGFVADRTLSDEEADVPSDLGYFDLKVEKKPEKKQKKTISSPLRSPSIISNNDEIIHHMRTPKFLAADDGDEDIPSLSGSTTNLSATNEARTNKQRPPTDVMRENAVFTKKQLQDELKGITFNELPAKGQHIILNELMQKTSPKEKTDVIFSTLPAPPLGTHLEDDDAYDYTHNLAIWLNELPPILLLNSQTVTVTTAL